MDSPRGRLARLRDSFLLSDHSHLSVYILGNDMWVSFKSEIIAAIEMFIPTKMTNYNIAYHGSTVLSNASLKNATNIIFAVTSQAALTLIKSHYKRFRAHVQMVIRDAYLKQVSNIFSFEMVHSYPNCQRENEKVKLFWPSVKSLKNVWDHHTQRK